MNAESKKRLMFYTKLSQHGYFSERNTKSHLRSSAFIGGSKIE